ncbi:hypothetical protein V8C26DRAFT_210960 [Trichoderma gracile]
MISMLMIIAFWFLWLTSTRCRFYLIPPLLPPYLPSSGHGALTCGNVRLAGLTPLTNIVPVSMSTFNWTQTWTFPLVAVPRLGSGGACISTNHRVSWTVVVVPRELHKPPSLFSPPTQIKPLTCPITNWPPGYPFSRLRKSFNMATAFRCAVPRWRSWSYDPFETDGIA